MTDVIDLTIGAELPDVTFTWRDRNGTLLAFGTTAHTFRFLLATPTPFVKTTGIAGADTDPNVSAAFTTTELDTLPVGIWPGQLWARRTSDSKDREPLPFIARVKAAIA